MEYKYISYCLIWSIFLGKIFGEIYDPENFQAFKNGNFKDIMDILIVEIDPPLLENMDPDLLSKLKASGKDK